jgi:hypothetical protein
LAYKYIFSLLLVFLLSCAEIDRDNILDPKNSSSHRDKVLLLEAFINTNNPLPYNEDALQAINILSADENLKDQLIVVEYHRNVTNPAYDDSLTFVEIENWYENYTIYYPQEERTKGVPDIFINGAFNRIQGASDETVVVNRVKAVTSELLLEEGKYTIEADFNQNGDEVKGKYRIAQLGNRSSDQMILRIIVTYNAETVEGITGVGKRTVSYFESHSIAAIDAGDYLEEDFQLVVDSQKADKLVFVLMDSEKLNVLHTFEKEIL